MKGRTAKGARGSPEGGGRAGCCCGGAGERDSGCVVSWLPCARPRPGFRVYLRSRLSLSPSLRPLPSLPLPPPAMGAALAKPDSAPDHPPSRPDWLNLPCPVKYEEIQRENISKCSPRPPPLCSLARLPPLMGFLSSNACLRFCIFLSLRRLSFFFSSLLVCSCRALPIVSPPPPLSRQP